MQSVEKYKTGEKILFIVFFLAACLLCSQISYTDGDDAYFFSMSHSMPILEYLKMRYVGWEGRLTSEAMTYIAFYFGRVFWQFANAVILTLLPAGLIFITKKIAGVMDERRNFFLAVIVYMLIFSTGIEVIGYGAFWITGSTFYLWSIVAGIWAAVPFVNLVYQKGGAKRKDFIYAIPCAFLTAMGQEQIAAVVIVFGCISICCHYYKQHKISWLHLLELVIMIVAFVILFVSPGTEARSQAEIVTWMPQYRVMPLGTHLFITWQWIMSSFANEGKMLFALLWLISACLLWQKGIRSRILAIVAAVAVLVSLLPYVGISFFSEMGMGITDITQCVWVVAEPSAIAWQNWVAIIWWSAAIVFTIFLMWKLGTSRCEKVTAGLIVLAAVASEAIMFFSPTMYASGPRVYFVSQVLIWLLIGMTGHKLLRQKEKLTLGIIALGGIVNFLSSIPIIIEYL